MIHMMLILVSMKRVNTIGKPISLVKEHSLLFYKRYIDYRTHIRCEFNVRGHFEVILNGVEFSTRVLKALDFPSMYKEDLNGRYLLFIDTESPDNEMIRHKIHLLPKELQSLSLPLDSSPLQWELVVKDWITAILRYEV